MRRITVSFAVSLIAAMGLISPGQIWAQSTHSEIHGAVTDPTGAAIANATIILTKIDTGTETPLATNEIGLYYGRRLNPGLYEIQAEFSGFKTFRATGIELRTGYNLEYPIKLEVGAVTETVEVSAEATAEIQTASGDVSSVVGSEVIKEMPASTRRVMEHMMVTPAVTITTKGHTGSLYMPFFSIAGNATDRSNTFVIDGTDANSVRGTWEGGSLPFFNPPTELVQEMRVLSNNYSAEFGGSTGSTIVMTTKGGSNEFHGQVYYYIQNDALDARNTFATSRPGNKYHSFGGYVGGPIVKDKTHFLFAREQELWLQGSAVQDTLPSLMQRQGDFSQTFDAGGGLVPIYDPASTMINPDGSGTRTQFPNNVIPTDRFDPVSARVVPMYPDPNQPGTTAGAFNFAANYLATDLDRPLTYVRLDHQFSSDHRAYLRVSDDPYSFPIQGAWTGTGEDSEIADPRTEKNSLSGFVVGASYDWIVSPTRVNHLGFSYAGLVLDRAAGRGRPAVYRQDWAGQLGLQNVDADFFPNFSSSGFTPIGGGTWFQDLGYNVNRGWGLEDTLTIMRGKHTFKTGVAYKNSRTALWVRTWPSGRTNYDARATAQPGVAGTGNSMASFLLGQVASALVVDVPAPMNRAYYLAGFFQDDWRVSPNLTMNLGVRYEYDRPKTDTALTRNYFNLTKINPACDCPGVIEFSSNRFTQEGRHTPDYGAIYNSIAPRIGFAYKLGGRQDLVVRGGIGLFYTGPDRADKYVFGPQAGAGYQGAWGTPDAGLTPAFRLSEGFPIAPQESLTDSWGAVPIGDNPRFSPQFYWEDRESGYSQQYNVGVQKQFGRTLLEVAFLGNRTRRLPARQPLAYNELRPEDRGPGNAQIRRPFPQFGNVTSYGESYAISDYYAGTIHLKRQFSNGLSFQTHYTYADHKDNFTYQKSRWDVGRDFVGKANYGPSGLMRRHRFVWSSVYELPWGPGRRLLSSGVLGNIIGGWDTGLTVEARSGQPLNIGNASNTCNCFSQGTQGVDLMGSPGDPPSNFDPGRDTWFNTSAFSAPAPFTFGNAGAGLLEAPGFFETNLTLSKRFSITERVSTEIRGEFFNLFNQVNLGVPGTNFGTGQFGRVSGTLGSPPSDVGRSRKIQMGAKILF